jgi:hypothetical protein
MEALRPLILITTSAITGALMGHLTYLATSTLGTWRNVHKVKITSAERRRVAKRKELDEKTAELNGVNQAIKALKELIEGPSPGPNASAPGGGASSQLTPQQRAELEAKLDKQLTAVESLRETIAQLAEEEHTFEENWQKEIHKDPKWEDVNPAIAFERRLMRLPLAVGVGIGFGFLGILLGVDSLSPKPDKPLQVGTIIGISFLIGLYPRVFENALKALADKLTGPEKIAGKKTDAPSAK